MLESENLRKTCTQISCKVLSVLLSEKLPTSRLATKCKPERTNRNCDMVYSSYPVLMETSIVPKLLLALFFSLMAVVSPTDRPKSVRNHCLIDVLVVVCIVTLLLQYA